MTEHSPSISRGSLYGSATKFIVATISVLFLAACAQPARVSQMAVSNVLTNVTSASPELLGAVTVGEVGGGQATNPIWTSQVDNPQFREALERSLEFNGLLAGGATPGRLVVSANLIELDQPLFGLNLTVTPRIAYRVTERASSTDVFREELITPYTAEFGSAFIAVERLRIANEGAIRESIRRFLIRFGEVWAARVGRVPATTTPAVPLEAPKPTS